MKSRILSNSCKCLLLSDEMHKFHTRSDTLQLARQMGAYKKWEEVRPNMEMLATLMGLGLD